MLCQCPLPHHTLVVPFSPCKYVSTSLFPWDKFLCSKMRGQICHVNPLTLLPRATELLLLLLLLLLGIPSLCCDD